MQGETTIRRTVTPPLVEDGLVEPIEEQRVEERPDIPVENEVQVRSQHKKLGIVTNFSKLCLNLL